MAPRSFTYQRGVLGAVQAYPTIKVGNSFSVRIIKSDNQVDAPLIDCDTQKLSRSENDLVGMNFTAAKLTRYWLAWFEDRKIILGGLVTAFNTGLMVSRPRLDKRTQCARHARCSKHEL